MNLYPEPNANGNGFNYVNSPVRKLDETKFDIRVDHNFSPSDSAFGRFSYDQRFPMCPAALPASPNPCLWQQSGIQNHGRNIALSETHIFFADHGQPDQWRLQSNFQLHHLSGHG